MKLWIGNLPQVDDTELVAFLRKYGCPEPAHIEHVPGDGSRPAVVLSFKGFVDAELGAIQTRLHGMYWKERQLVVQTLIHTNPAS